MSKPALYCVSDNGCFGDEAVAVAFCLRAHFRESRVAMSVWHELCVYLALVGMATMVDVGLMAMYRWLQAKKT